MSRPATSAQTIVFAQGTDMSSGMAVVCEFGCNIESGPEDGAAAVAAAA